jgi:hypothetical protein
MAEWRNVRCASNLSHGKARINGGGLPVDIPNLTRVADRYWPENPDNDLNLLGLN